MTIKEFIPDQPETFKGVRIHAFCYFKVMQRAFIKFKGRDWYLAEKQRRYDCKKLGK